MIYRLRYCNKDGVEARVDIQKGLGTPVIDVEGTERPFILSYNNDKGDKSGMFLSSSADIEIYETTDFNIDNLKTSNETELSVTHYINNVVSWQGFIIPDFFSIEVRSNPVIAMTASDRLGTLKNVTLSNLPSMISLRELAILCLNKTGLSLPLRTMADFNNGTGVNDFFNSKILTQRLSDTKGRSISCYDILSSILTASNSFLVQRSGAWHIINKIQHEAGSGKLYTGATSFINWSDVIFNFSDISIGGRRTIIPVASTVGVFHEFGGGRIYPENYDFSLDLTGWTAVNGFVAVIDNRKVDNFVSGTGVISQEWTTDPVFGDATEKKYLVNDNYGINYDFADKPYLRSSNIPVTYPNISQVKVNVEVNATGPYIDSETYRGETNFAVIASNGTSTLHLTGSGTFEPLSGDPFLHKVLFDGDTHLQAVTSSRSVNGVLAVQDGNLSGYDITVRIYGYTKGVTGGRFLVTTLVNSVAVTITDISDEAKGTLYKTERTDNYTKAHDIDTSLFADYLTTGLNGYFYSFPIDDTSLIYNSNNELTSKWTAYNDTEQLPLLQHVTRQRSRLFSVAHDLLSAEIEATDFDPLAIFVACGIRHTVVSAQFDFFKSNLSVELEEIDFQIASARDFIYSYFGDGEEGIKSIGGISGGAGGGGSTGGGLTPEQLEILSWWKKDPDNPDTIFTEMNAYSTKELSAYGVGDGEGGGGGSDYERLDTWPSYDSSRAGWVLSAFLGNDLNTRVTAIDGRVTDLENSSDFGNLEIGGRNLILQSQARAEATNGSTQNWITPAYYLSEPLKIGQKYTFYCEGIQGTSINRLSFRDPTSDFLGVTGNKHTFIATAESTYLYLYLTDYSATYKIGGIKLVKGDKCDDWTPAPEDQVSDWNTTDVDSFSFIKNKPTTLAGYGITDAYTKTEVNSALVSKLDKSVFDDLFEKVEVGTGVFAIKAKYNFYGVGEISAYGIGTGGGSGGGIIETVYGYGNLGQTFNNSILTDTFNAYTINQINTRLVSVESGSATSINTTGTGNAITSISKTGSVITANKGLTFSLSNHLHTGIYEPAFSKNTAFNKNFGTASGTVAQGNDSRIINGQTAFGWGNHSGLYLPLSDAVTINTAQTITGDKIFEGGLSILSSNSFLKISRIGGNNTLYVGADTTQNTIYSRDSGTGVSPLRIVVGVTEVMIFSNDYNVGIGTTSPSQKLHVVGNILATGTVTAPTFSGNLSGNATSATKLQTAITIAGVSFDGTANIAIPFANLSSKPTTLGEYGITDAVTLNTVQTITAQKTFNDGDNVYGLNAKPSIIVGDGGTTKAGAIKLMGNIAGAYGLLQATILDVELSHNSGAVYIQHYGAGKVVMATGGGNVGVNTTSPSEKLHVVGNILATGTTATTKVIFNAAGWSMEQVGSELQMKHNNVLKMRFTSAGSIVATEEITAFG